MNALDKEGLTIVAQLMAIAARTAPKTGGADWITTEIATVKEKKDISRMMQRLGKMKEKAYSKTNLKRGVATRIDWMSDAQAVENSGLLFLIGVQGRKVVTINCGGCGFSTCSEMLKQKPLSIKGGGFSGPYCMYRIMDLSIAAGSAVKTAMDNNVDNRMMQKVGVAALRLGLLKPCDLILGIPLCYGKEHFLRSRRENGSKEDS